MEENKSKNEFKNSFLSFARSVTPQPIEVKQGTSDDNFVKWGNDNLYCNFLLQLFHENSIHSGVSKSKVQYLMGDGVVEKATGKPAEFDVNDVDTFEEIVRRLILDFLIMNFFCVEVQYNVFGEVIAFNHVPAHHVRTNKSKTKFWISDDWKLKKSVLTYDRWKRGTNEDGKSKIYMYSGYVPSVNNVYPQVSYSAAVENMVTEMLIKEFNKNNIEDGFSPAHIISFFKGTPTSEQAKELERKFEANFSGSTGKKFMLNYNDLGADKGIQVDTLNSVDYASALTEVRNNNIESILTVHQATSRVLYGIESPGSLGDKSALETSYQIFKSVFVKDTRNVIESGLNKLLKASGFPEIEFKDKSTLFNSELDTQTREKVLKIDELRAIDGLEPLENNLGNRLISDSGSHGEPQFNTSKFSDDDKYKNGRILNEEDFELVKDLGADKGDYSIISTDEFHVHNFSDMKKLELQFDDEKDVDNHLIEKDINGKTLAEIKAEIKKELGISVTTDSILERIIALTEAKLINSEIVEGKVKTTPVEPKKGRTVEVMYEYKVKAGYGDPIIPNSRAFCVKLIELDRLFSRSEIQSMSTLLGYGYDIFTHTGGWYFNPRTQKAENQCRHEWKKVSVIRKGNHNNG